MFPSNFKSQFVVSDTWLTRGRMYLQSCAYIWRRKQMENPEKSTCGLPSHVLIFIPNGLNISIVNNIVIFPQSSHLKTSQSIPAFSRLPSTSNFSPGFRFSELENNCQWRLNSHRDPPSAFLIILSAEFFRGVTLSLAADWSFWRESEASCWRRSKLLLAASRSWWRLTDEITTTPTS